MPTKIRKEQLNDFDGWIPANETWTYAGADDPTFIFSISGDKTGKYSPGMKIRLNQTTDKYFIITGVSFGTNTTITVYGGTDYDLANATIASPCYSSQKAPFGFPLNPTKWTVEVTDVTDRYQATPTQNTWYNLNSTLITIPIGVWDLSYRVSLGADRVVSTVSMLTQVTLSTANNSESDADLTSMTLTLNSTSDSDAIRCSVYKDKIISLAAKTIHYLNTRTTSASVGNIYNGNTSSKLIIRAVCAYL